MISLQTTHDFILPNSIKEIAVKLAEKPSETSQLKLEFNYAIVTAEDLANKDSKMNGYPKDQVSRVVVAVHRLDVEEGRGEAVVSPRGSAGKEMVSATPRKF